MNKIIKIVSVIIFFVLCIFTNKTSFAAEKHYISVDYHISIEQQKLRVTAQLSNIKTKYLYISFTDEQAGIDNLSSRISDLKFMDIGKNSLLNSSHISRGLYRVNTEGNPRILLTYTFDPNTIKHDVHLTTLTSSYLHIPGLDFFVRVFDDQNKMDDINNVLCKDFTVNLDNLPNNWETIVTYPRTKQGGIVVTDYEVLISAGNYERSSFEVQGCHYTIAFDKEKQFNSKEYEVYFKQIINDYNKLFKNSTVTQQLIVINQSREKFDIFSCSLSGQYKNQNIIMEFGGVNTTNQEKRRAEVVQHISHEIFHIWLPGAFKVDEDWPWFWEGFTEYNALRTILQLGIINESEFKQRLASKYFEYDHLEDVKNKVNLLEASKQEFYGNEWYQTLIYDKGTLVAYLYDKTLKQSGKSFDAFISAIYNELALSQVPVKSNDIIGFMNKFSGDDSFTKYYVQGVENLPIVPAEEFGISYYIEYFKKPLGRMESSNTTYYGQPPFPYNFLIPATILIIIALVIWGFRKRT